MSVLPEWINFSSVDLTDREKKDLLEFCEFLTIKCRCSEVDQCGHKFLNFCNLCHNIIKSPQPSILLNQDTFVTVRELFSSNYYKMLRIKIKFVFF